MNKLSLVGEQGYIIETKDNEVLNLENEVLYYNYDNNNHNLTFNIKDYSNITLNFVKILSNSNTITININNNIEFNFTLLIINDGNNTLNLKINTLGNNNNIKIKVRLINKNSASKINLICDGYINKSTENNTFTEDLKGLIVNNDYIKISPNIYVDTNNVLANHLVTISSFNPHELFYLNLKGISLNLAKEMLIKAFINSNDFQYFKDLLSMEVINIE